MKTPDHIRKHPLADSQFLQHPLETHEFVVNPQNDYLCLKCGRNRSLHHVPDNYVDTPYRPKKNKARPPE